tara:strand:- start:70 stop:348 length:279 start_codon:yes stop_codon:yes gene_type:complete
MGKAKIARGTSVKMRGHLGSVFWSGACKHTGRARIGMEDRTGAKHWGFEVECKIADPAPGAGARSGPDWEEDEDGVPAGAHRYEDRAMYGDD